MEQRHIYLEKQMNTVTKFENRKTEIFNGFDMLKNHFLSTSPVIYTENTDDYSQALAYADTHDFVWLINPNIEIVSYFPYWYRVSRNETNTAYEFPYVNSKSYKVMSWDKVKLVPTHGNVENVVQKKVICGFYDVYRGKSEFDIFYLGKPSDDNYKYLIENHSQVYCVDSVKHAFDITETDMFWIVPAGIILDDEFKFDTVPNDRSYDVPHVFGHGDNSTHTGVVLMSKNYMPTDRELEYNFYAKKRIVRQIASHPA
jgi:hypothetical protein